MSWTFQFHAVKIKFTFRPNCLFLKGPGETFFLLLTIQNFTETLKQLHT